MIDPEVPAPLPSVNGSAVGAISAQLDERFAFILCFTAMKMIATWLGVALVVSACSKTEDDWPDYTAGSGDLAAFTIESAVKLGARPKATKGLPQLNAQWHYKTINDRTQVVLTGNHFMELQSVLTNAFGPFPQPLKPNDRSMGANFGSDIGAEIKLTWDKTTDDKEYTTLVIARAQKPPKTP